MQPVTRKVNTGSSVKVGRDLDPYEERAHDIGDHHSRYPKRGERHPDALGSVAVQREIHHDDADPTKHKHESRREPLDDVLTIDATREEDERPDDAGGPILCATDPRRLHDHIVDEAGDHRKVGEQKKGQHGHRGGENQGREPQAGARRTEETVGQDLEHKEGGVDRTQIGRWRGRHTSGGGGGGTCAGILRFRSHFSSLPRISSSGATSVLPPESERQRDFEDRRGDLGT